MKRDIACEKCSLKYYGYPASKELKSQEYLEEKEEEENV